MRISETTGPIFSIKISIELSRPLVVQRQLFAHSPSMGVSMGKKTSSLKPLGVGGGRVGIVYLLSSIELCRPVVVQHQGHLPFRPP